MERSRPVQSDGRLQVVRLSIPVGLAMLFVVILLWASTGGTPAIASPPAVAEAMVLNNGNVITIGVATDMSGPAESTRLAASQRCPAGDQPDQRCGRS